MDNPNNRELTFEEAVNAISGQNDDGGFDPREKVLKKTAKDDTDNMIR